MIHEIKSLDDDGAELLVRQNKGQTRSKHFQEVAMEFGKKIDI